MSVLSTCSSSCDCGGLLEPAAAALVKPGVAVLTSFGASSPGAASTPLGSPRSASSDDTSDAVCVFQSDDAEAVVVQGAAASCGAGAPAGSRGSVLPSSAEFIMYEWKTRDCPLGDEEHDWSTCVFAHPGEKARRRTPRDRAYNALCCPDVRRRGRCPRGDSCPFAHSVFEIHLHPARFRTKMCRDGTSCSRAVCFFAHTPEELRTPAPADVAALEQRKAAQQLQAQAQQQKAQRDHDLLSSQGGKGLAKPTAAPLLAAKLSAATRALRVPGPAPAPVRRDEMANARIRVWQHLLSLRAQQEQADALRIAAESGAMLRGGSPVAHGLAAGLVGSGHDTPLFGSSPPTPLTLGAAVSAAVGPAACGLGTTLPSALDGFGLGDVALAPLQPLGSASGPFDAFLGAATLPLAPPHEASVAPLLGSGWQGMIGGSPPAVCQPAVHGAAPFLPSFPLW